MQDENLGRLPTTTLILMPISLPGAWLCVCTLPRRCNRHFIQRAAKPSPIAFTYEGDLSGAPGRSVEGRRSEAAETKKFGPGSLVRSSSLPLSPDMAADPILKNCVRCTG